MSQNRWWAFAVVGAILVSGFPSRAALAVSPKNESSPSKPHSSQAKLIRKKYAIAGLVDPTTGIGAETLIKAIVRSVKPKSWKEKGGSATIKYLAEKEVLAVKQTVEGHQRIACILKALKNIYREEQATITAKPEGKEPAECKRLAAEDGKKEVKVLLWTEMSVDPGKELIQADRCLADKIAKEIRRLSEENHEKVTIINPSLVEQYKKYHPNWQQTLALQRVGRHFEADYVIVLEIVKLGIYEPGANQQIYRGQTQIGVSVLDMKHPDDIEYKEFNDRYPSEARGDMTPYDVTPTAFREKFLEHAAKRFAFYFVDHKKGSEQAMLDD